jgi:hypothetical protein
VEHAGNGLVGGVLGRFPWILGNTGRPRALILEAIGRGIG